MNNARGRDDSIDFLRGIAIFLVIIGHYFTGRIRLFIFAFHIPLFLMISGYLFKLHGNFCEYVKRAFRKLLVPFVLCIVIMLFIDAILGKFSFGRVLAGVFVYANANMNHALLQIDTGIGPIWFLPAMFVTSAISCILIKMFQNHSRVLIIAGSAVSFGD